MGEILFTITSHHTDGVVKFAEAIIWQTKIIIPGTIVADNQNSKLNRNTNDVQSKSDTIRDTGTYYCYFSSAARRTCLQSKIVKTLYFVKTENR